MRRIAAVILGTACIFGLATSTAAAAPSEGPIGFVETVGSIVDHLGILK
ncbi:hypothetical protein ACIQ9Q_25620 [Streptomyces sp. NPDC094438]